MDAPLAERLRPQKIEDYIGQEHLMGKEGVIRQMITSGHLPSIILWGPPGVGKTTLANIISNTLDRPFYTLSAINSGVKDVREVLEKAGSAGLFGQGQTPILFIDEIHRFSKSQQDSLLGAVEKGVVTLIGATTENPSFEVISALLSRCQVYVLKHHTEKDIRKFIDTAIDKEFSPRGFDIEIKEIEVLYQVSGGDGRRLLNNFELIINASESKKISITNELVKSLVKSNPLMFDKTGDQHYDIASALIKSIRGSDIDASLYYLARMIEGGEDPKFIARRLLISASEDVGLANPTALVIANNCFQAIEKIGMPEARIILSQATVYLAGSPKSNSSYEAIDRALALVKETGDLPIPLHLRNAPSELMKNLDYGKDYKYPHAFPGNFVEQEYLPAEIKRKQLFFPSANGREMEIKKRMDGFWKDKYEK